MRARERKVLSGLIDKFLAEKRVSDGGLAPVTEEDIVQLHVILNRIIRMKWGADPDGDWPINWQLIDRTRFEPMHYRPVPYEHEAEGVARLERLNIVLLNANIANRELDVTLRILQAQLRENTRGSNNGGVEPEPKARYKCPKCGWAGKESGLSSEETSGDAYCPDCGAECKRIHKKS
jgi:predicted RNA-binding Zn-ribbon protein involved in translation (DUF1610 family)